MSTIAVPILMTDSLGNQIQAVVVPGKASVQDLSEVLTAINDLHIAHGGIGFMFRVEDDPKYEWHRGVPPEEEHSIWVVKTAGEKMDTDLPEEVVISDGQGSFVRLSEHDNEPPNFITEIIKYRPLTDQENEFLINPYKMKFA